VVVVSIIITTTRKPSGGGGAEGSKRGRRSQTALSCAPSADRRTATSPAAQTKKPPPLPNKQTVLALSPDDADALAAKAVAHLELGEFDAAHAALSAPTLAEDPGWQLERAYCLYRRGLLREALAALSGTSGGGASNGAGGVAGGIDLPSALPEDRASAGVQLRAQLHYRLGDAAACVRDYGALLLLPDANKGGKAAAAAAAAAALALSRHGDTQAQLLEIKTNAVAAHVAAGLGAQVPQLVAALKLPTGRAAQGFEAEYNRACALVAAGDLPGAEAALRHALRAGEEALYAEDLAEAEVLDELAPVSAQLAYVCARLGRTGEALARLEPLVQGELSDGATAAVAAVNHAACALAALGGGAGGAGASGGASVDPAAAKSAAAKALKRLEHAISDRASSSSAAGGGASAGAPAPSVLALRPELASRLSPAQQRAVHLSRALLMGMAGRVDQAREVAAALAKQQQQQQQSQQQSQQPPPLAADPRVSLLLAALLARAGKAADAETALAGLAGGGGDHPMGHAEEAEDDADAVDPCAPALLRAQLAAEAGDAGRAAALLAGLPGGAGAGLAPGVLATRVALLERAGQGAAAEALLEQGLDHWQQRAAAAAAAGGGRGAAAAAAQEASAAAGGVGWCLQRLVALKLAAGKTPEAMRLYQQLMAGSQGGAAAKLAASGGGAGGGKKSAAAAAVASGAAGASVVARLARAAAASGDGASVATLARQLPAGSTDAAGAGVDTDALEDVTRVLGARARRAPKDEAANVAAAAAGEGEGEGAAAGLDAAAARKRPKRKRKPRLPAAYDPARGPGGGLPAPDPERWLPKWQRANFKKQQRRRNRDARDRVVGSQGAGRVDEALDRTGKAGLPAAPEEPAAAAARPNLPPRAKGRPRK